MIRFHSNLSDVGKWGSDQLETEIDRRSFARCSLERAEVNSVNLLGYIK